MNWEAISAVGEIVGAIAVIVTFFQHGFIVWIEDLMERDSVAGTAPYYENVES